MKWDDEDEFLEKEDNYTGRKIEIYRHPKEMSKFKSGETVRKMFDKLWHDRKISFIDKKNKLYHVKYNNNDSEDYTTMAEVRKYWVKPEPEEDKSSSKKKQLTKKNYTISDKI